MAKRATAKAIQKQADPGSDDQPIQVIKRRTNGTFLPGYSGSLGTDAARARRKLNATTIHEMQLAFDKYGREAIAKVAKQSPAIFLKMLVLLVPRELEVTHSQGVKGLSDEQIASAIEAIEQMLARRTGESAKVIEPDAPSASDP